MASQALGHHRDDGVAGLGTARVNDIMGSGTAPGAQHRMPEEDDVVVGSGTVLWAWR
jgi:hypothetical protein